LEVRLENQEKQHISLTTEQYFLLFITRTGLINKVFFCLNQELFRDGKEIQDMGLQGRRNAHGSQRAHETYLFN
jgi:hypothetical protein